MWQLPAKQGKLVDDVFMRAARWAFWDRCWSARQFPVFFDADDVRSVLQRSGLDPTQCSTRACSYRLRKLAKEGRLNRGYWRGAYSLTPEEDPFYVYAKTMTSAWEQEQKEMQQQGNDATQAFVALMARLLGVEEDQLRGELRVSSYANEKPMARLLMPWEKDPSMFHFTHNISSIPEGALRLLTNAALEWVNEQDRREAEDGERFWK